MSAKLKEAQEHCKQAEKYLKTTLLRWKPDYDNAADEYIQAAQCYRIARQLVNAKECYMKARDVYKKSATIFHAAKSLDNAMLVAKEKTPPEEIFAMANEASTMYREHGSFDSAAVCLERASRILEERNPAMAVELLMQAADYTLTDRAQGCEYLRKCSRLMVLLKRYDEAVGCIRREIAFQKDADNLGALGRLAVMLVLVHLARGDIVAAEKAYRELGCNCEASERQTIQQVLDAFDGEDAEAAAKALASPFIRSMDVEFSRLAGTIPLPKMTAPVPKPGVRAGAAEPYIYTPIAGHSHHQYEESPYDMVTFKKEVKQEPKLEEIHEDDTELC